MWFVFSEPAVTAFNSKPDKPALVKEMDNVTLEWTYTLDGTIFSAFFYNITLNQITIARRGSVGEAIVAPDYQERFRAEISDTQALLTIVGTQRSDRGEYEFNLETDKFVALVDAVKLFVQCE